jgi:hypothetical protein
MRGAGFSRGDFLLNKGQEDVKTDFLQYRRQHGVSFTRLCCLSNASVICCLFFSSRTFAACLAASHCVINLPTDDDDDAESTPAEAPSMPPWMACGKGGPPASLPREWWALCLLGRLAGKVGPMPPYRGKGGPPASFPASPVVCPTNPGAR